MTRASGKDAIDPRCAVASSARRALDRVFRGEVSGWPYALTADGEPAGDDHGARWTCRWTRSVAARQGFRSMRSRALLVVVFVSLAASAFAQGGATADGTTPLHWGGYKDDVAGAAALMKSGAKVNAANDLGATPLWLASFNGNADMVRTLLQAGANPNLALLAGETPLMIASRTGNAAVVEQLAAKGASLNARGARGQTALMWAVAQKHPDVVKALLARGADVHARSETWSQMMAVPPHGRLEYNRLIPHGGDTALLFAARVGDLASARLLVAAGANVNDADAWGVSAVALATHTGFADLLDFLLERGANPNSPAADFAALHAAVMRRDERMAAALLAHGADPNVRIRNWDADAPLVRGLPLPAARRRRHAAVAGCALCASGPDAAARQARRRREIRAPRRLLGRRARVAASRRGHHRLMAAAGMGAAGRRRGCRWRGKSGNASRSSR